MCSKVFSNINVEFATQNQQVFPAEEFQALLTMIPIFIETLEDASHSSRDPPDEIDVSWVSRDPSVGVGAPQVNIDPSLLHEIVNESHKWTDMAVILGCHARTIRRRALQAGLVSPGQPVYNTVHDADGVTSRQYIIQGPRSRTSTLTDVQLDEKVGEIIERFPLYGREMTKGHLAGMGEVVPMDRIRESLVRVRGPPQPFGYREQPRKIYDVPGANSLWHHDGQHGASWV